jgi:sigma-E factor negative regulatory protein RseC
MAEKGQVLEVLSDGCVSVKLTRTEACAKCGACAVAGEDMIVKARNPDHALPEQWVSLELAPNRFLYAALILYGIPLVALFIGAIVGYYVAEYLNAGGGSALAGFATGLVFTAISYWAIHGREKRLNKSSYMPVAHL